MPAIGTTTFSDPSVFQADFRGATINLVFTGPGIFSARLTSVSLPHLELHSVQENLARIAYVSLPSKYVNFTFATRTEPSPIWGGVKMKSRDLTFHGVGESTHQRTAGAGGWGIISVDPEFFARSSNALTGSEIIPPPIGRIVQASQADADQLRRLHARACRLGEINRKMVAHRQVARAIENDLIHALVNCLTAGVVRADTAKRRHCAIVMSRFEDVLAAKPNRQVPIPELCGAIRVAERTLRTCVLGRPGHEPEPLYSASAIEPRAHRAPTCRSRNSKGFGTCRALRLLGTWTFCHILSDDLRGEAVRHIMAASSQQNP